VASHPRANRGKKRKPGPLAPKYCSAKKSSAWVGAKSTQAGLGKDFLVGISLAPGAQKPWEDRSPSLASLRQAPE
jgi:hypothetical protein